MTIELKGAQWSRAKQEREKYWIYVLKYNRETESGVIVKIQDPITNWDQEELDLIRVEVKLRLSE